MQAIRNWIFNLGKRNGIDGFLERIGPWWTFAIALVIGLISLAVCALLIKVILSIKSKGWKIGLLITLFAVALFLGYMYVDGTIDVIRRLGGLHVDIGRLQIA